MRVHLCGVRGSTPAPGSQFLRYGGHTSCVALAHDDSAPTLILDTGTGVRLVPELLGGASFNGAILYSHLHWDHCSGNTILRGDLVEPAFPRARYYAPRGEWEHAHERNVRDAVSYLDANYDPLVESGRMTLVEGAYEVLPGIWMRTAPGHTRDMMVVTAESAGETFCFLSDLVPTAAHVQPAWVTAFDLYPLGTIANKTKWLGAAAAGNWLCGFAHDSVAFARIATDPKKQFTAVVA